MILQSLAEYHHEQVVANNPFYASQGMELKRIHFVLVISSEGVLTDITQPKQKMSVARSRQRSGKNSWLTANCLWDSLSYVTGYGTNEKEQAMATLQHRSFMDMVTTLSNAFPENRSFKAVYAYYSRTELTGQLLAHPLWHKIASKKGHNLSFRLAGESLLAAQQPELMQIETSEKRNATCMVSGHKAAIQLKHPATYFPGGAATGSKLVSFTRGCGYDSYYKCSGENAPVSVEVTESYAAALTGLLQQDSDNCVVIDKVSFLYYTLPNTSFNGLFHTLLDPSVKSGGKEALARLTEFTCREEEFVLMAIVPNAARLSVRLFLRTTVDVVASNLLLFYQQTGIPLTLGNFEVLPIMSFLFMAAPQGNIRKMPPQLVIDYLSAVVTASPFPIVLQYELLSRIRESNGPKNTVASLLGCYLDRNKQNNILMALDKENNSIGYVLGRTFAILERAQELSAPGINFTIRDGYYHIASTTPSTVFNRLIGLSAPFFRKIPSQGTMRYLRNQLSEVTALLDGNAIPLRLSIDEQSGFALGYFHQRQTYFIKREEQNE